MSDYESSMPVKTRDAEELQIKTKTGSVVVVEQSVPSSLQATVTQAATVVVKPDTIANQGNGPLKANLRDAADAELKGQKAMADSVPVTLASDQSTINVNVVSSVAANPLHDYNTVAAVAAGASSTHTYTVPSGKMLKLGSVFASASGAMKVEVKTGATGLETTKAVAFTTASDPNAPIEFENEIAVAEGDNVLVVRTNRDKQAMDVYSFVNGIL